MNGKKVNDMSQRKALIAAGVLLLLFTVLLYCVYQIAHEAKNSAMLVDIALAVLTSGIVTITLAYFGANVLDKGKGMIEAFKGRNNPTETTGQNGGQEGEQE